MKKSYIIILVILLITAAYFFFSDRSSTLKSEYSDFAIEDTSAITKVFIADYSGGTALLERMPDNTWKINGKYKVRKDGMDLLLKTFKMIAVKEPVAKASRETVIKELVDLTRHMDLIEPLDRLEQALKTLCVEKNQDLM